MARLHDMSSSGGGLSDGRLEASVAACPAARLVGGLFPGSASAALRRRARSFSARECGRVPPNGSALGRRPAAADAAARQVCATAPSRELEGFEGG
jgi:hypothetical protein